MITFKKHITLLMILFVSLFLNTQLCADIYKIPQKQVMENQNTEVLDVKKATVGSKQKGSDAVVTQEELVETRTTDSSMANKEKIINKNFVEVSKGVNFESL